MRARLTLYGLTLLLAACSGKGSPPAPSPNPPPNPGPGAETTTITIPNSDGYGASSFSPGSVTIPVGRTVIWSNRDTFVHTTTSDTNIWASDIPAGGEASRTFTAAGTFNYRCTLHVGMNGSITVQ